MPTGDGAALAIDVNCASDGYRVTIVSTVVVQGTIVSGSWQETTRQISGDVSGSIPDPTTDQASLQTQGSELQGASITSSRR